MIGNRVCLPALYWDCLPSASECLATVNVFNCSRIYLKILLNFDTMAPGFLIIIFFFTN